MSGILEGRHAKQDQLYITVERNLALAAEALIATAEEYEASDTTAANLVTRVGRSSGT